MGGWEPSGFGVRAADVWIFDQQFGLSICLGGLRCNSWSLVLGIVAWVGCVVSWRSGDGRLEMGMRVKVEPLELWRWVSFMRWLYYCSASHCVASFLWFLDGEVVFLRVSKPHRVGERLLSRERHAV